MSQQVSQNAQNNATPQSKRTEFKFEDAGVFGLIPTPKGTKRVWVCGPLKIIGQGRDSDSKGWCACIRFQAPDNHVHNEVISFEDLTSDPKSVISHLASLGLHVSPHREGRDLFAQFLQSTVEPDGLVSVTDRLGWHGDDYVFASDALTDRSRPVFYSGPDRNDSRVRCSGTLEEWQSGVGSLCQLNSRLQFAVSAAFLAPVLRLLGEESAGFHLVGQTTGGKTTALTVAGSVWGGGHQNGFVRSWRTTENACENLARGHRDGILLLDELAQIDPKEAATVAYTILNGQSKSRMQYSKAHQKSSDWMVVLLSSGEISLGDHVATAGVRITGGQEIRILDVPADARAGMGVFEELHGISTPSEFARTISTAALTSYGTPIRRFLQLLRENREECLTFVREMRDGFLEDEEPFLERQALRGARRFALVCAVGELVSKLGVTGWPKGQAYSGGHKCYLEWLENRGTAGSSDSEAAISQVLGFIEAHGESRFATEEDADAKRIVYNRAGFRRPNFVNHEYEYLFLPNVFRDEVCKGLDYRAVLKALKLRGLLRVQGDNRLTVKRRILDMPANQGYYAIVIG